MQCIEEVAGLIIRFRMVPEDTSIAGKDSPMQVCRIFLKSCGLTTKEPEEGKIYRLVELWQVSRGPRMLVNKDKVLVLPKEEVEKGSKVYNDIVEFLDSP